MTDKTQARPEILLLCGLLLADAAFYFILIPHGIFDPQGFGLDQGLPPSFTAKVAAILMAAIMSLRLFQLLTNPAAASMATTDPAEGDASTGEELTLRNVAGIAVAMIFAFFLVPLIGYYPAGLCLIAALMRAMGETSLVRLVWQPVAVIGLIWLLFDQIFSIRLPVGQLFGG